MPTPTPREPGAVDVNDQDPLLGRLLDGRYRLDEVIARGGMATVYLATDTRLDRTVAVKVMRPLLAEDPDFVERFAREARSAARLSAPEVVAVHDQGTDAATRTAFLVMEHVAGGTLRDVVDQGPVAPARALALLEPVLRALAAAHAAGLVHRDVKPENVLLGDDGRVKVADFGLARAIETSTLTVTTGLLIGTVAYLAPEQVELGRADTRTDVYAAGVLLFELLTGAPPYASDSPLSVAYRHVHEDVPPPGRLVEGIPASLDELVVRATRRDPSARPVDAGAFLAELQAVRADLGASTGGPVVRRTAPTLVVRREAGPLLTQPAPAPARTRRRRRTAWALAAVLLLAVALTGGAYAFGTAATPSVLGLTRAQTETALGEAGLEVRLLPPRSDERVAAGLVLDQDPGPGARLRKGSSVSVQESLGPDRRAVPTGVVGALQPAATAALQRVGLRLGPVTQAFDSRPTGTVLSADPAPGARLRPGTAVALTVSKGPDLLPVPDVTGQPLERATRVLAEAGFETSSSRVFSERVPSGSVVSQRPADGRAVRDSTIALTVSRGPELIPVPDLRGRTAPQAEAALTALGLEGRAFDLPDGQGSVVTQSPRAGSTVRRGSVVTYYVL